MAKRSKEEREEERKKELLRTLRRGPDLDRYIDERKRNFVSYAQGARMYSMNYYSCPVKITDIVESHQGSDIGYFFVCCA